MFRKYESLANVYRMSNSFTQDDEIVIEEKLDGMNVSIWRDEDGCIRFGRRRDEILDSKEGRGFQNWVKENLDLKTLPSNMILYGEFLAPHKINYGEHQNTFVLFDVYLTEMDTYFTRSAVDSVACVINAKQPKVFYSGKFISWEHVQEFVGRSDWGQNGIGEGVVVKTQAPSRKIAKWVSESFRETLMEKKPPRQVNMQLAMLFDNLCTHARVIKTIHKGLDEEAYSKLDKSEYGKIMKFCSNYIIQDILDEDKDLFPEGTNIEEFIKVAGKRIPPKIREVLESNENIQESYI